MSVILQQGAHPGGQKEVERERRKSLALDRRKTAAIHQGSSKGAVKAFGHGTLTPRALVKRSQHKEHVLNILAEKNLRAGAFGKVETQEDQASWKVRPNAQQSPQVLNLKKRMEQRKRQMKHYTANHTFVDIFKEAEERRPHMPHDFVVAGTVELVAREVIDRNAEIQHREKKGVWAQLGKPYTCFGVPAAAIPRDCPMPVGNQAGELHSFLAHTQREEALEFWKDSAKFRRRPRSVTTSESLNMQGMLIKLSQQGSAKFPRQPLVLANDLKTTVKYGGSCYTVGASIGSRGRSRQQGKSRLSLDLSELFDSWRSASGGSQSVMDMDFSGAPPPPPKLSVRESIRSLPQLAISPTPQPERPSSSFGSDTLLYDWKKQFADMRKRLQENLNKRLMGRTVRRRHCRSCSPFTAELSSKLMTHLEERGGSKTPITTAPIWKSVEEKQAKERDAMTEVDPEVENISKFYERTCAFVNNQKMDDPLMDLLVAYLKELLEQGHKLQKALLVALCERLSKLEDHVQATGRMACLMPILNFICKELRLSSAEFNIILAKFGLDWYNSFSRPSVFGSPPLV